MNIVLHSPAIPQNTGNIGRTCVATNCKLHFIEPLGFDLSEKSVKRAGLDYWPELDYEVYPDYETFLIKNGFDNNGHSADGRKIFMATTKSKQCYSDVSFGPDDYIMFGREDAGIPEEILVDNEETCIRIPMYSDKRSLNLSNSVAIVLYEALRQNDFIGLTMKGDLARLHWKN